MRCSMSNAEASSPERPRDRMRWLVMVEGGSIDVFEQVKRERGLGLPEFSARKRRALADVQKTIDWLDAAEAAAPDLISQITKRMRAAK